VTFPRLMLVPSLYPLLPSFLLVTYFCQTLLVTQILKKILRSKQQFKLVVSTIKDYLWINDFEFDWRYYEVLWHCVQNLPYLDFYQAWYDENSTLSASTQTIEAQNLDFS
jgi:hypothetical protein